MNQFEPLRRTVRRLSAAGIEASLFVDPDPAQLEAAARTRAPCVELHTGAYCGASGAAARRELERLVAGARLAHKLGLRVNAGHGLNLENIGGVLRMPFLDTLNIGHSIVARAVLVGMAAAVREMRRAMRAYRGGE